MSVRGYVREELFPVGFVSGRGYVRRSYIQEGLCLGGILCTHRRAFVVSLVNLNRSYLTQLESFVLRTEETLPYYSVCYSKFLRGIIRGGFVQNLLAPQEKFKKLKLSILKLQSIHKEGLIKILIQLCFCKI